MGEPEEQNPDTGVALGAETPSHPSQEVESGGNTLNPPFFSQKSIFGPI